MLIVTQLLKRAANTSNATSSDALDADEPLEAAYWNSIHLAKRGNLLAGMDGYLGILRQDKTYRKGEVKDIFVGWLALICENHPDARDYRRALSKVLFQRMRIVLARKGAGGQVFGIKQSGVR